MLKAKITELESIVLHIVAQVAMAMPTPLVDRLRVRSSMHIKSFGDTSHPDVSQVEIHLTSLVADIT
jgi:hypothetical protein